MNEPISSRYSALPTGLPSGLPLPTFFIGFFTCAILTGCGATTSRPLPGTAAGSVTPICEASAHRGLREEGPDNSLRAIRRALDSEITFVEVDVRWGADGELFLFHDRRLHPPGVHSPATLFGKRPEELTTAERASICLDSSEPCTRIPTLRSALELLKNRESFYQLDLKGDSYQALPIIQQQATGLGVADQVIIQCYSLEDFYTVKRNFPVFKTLYRTASAAQFLDAVELQPEIIQGDLQWMTKELTTAAHNRGIRVLVKTLSTQSENPGTYQTLFRKGVDIILSDAPTKAKRMARFVEECGSL